MRLNRRQFGKLSGAAFLAGPLSQWPGISLAGNPTGKPLHGISAFGDLKYGPDYPHFDYVNVDAPKGGKFNFSMSYWFYNQNPQTFDTLNSFVLKGNAPPRMEHCFDALMVTSGPASIGPIDEPASCYGRLAETVTISEDRNTYTFKLRPEPRWHDGTPLTAEDVAFTYNTFKKDGHPDLALTLLHFSEARALDERTVELVFDGKQSDRVILSVVAMPIVSKAFYGVNDFTQSALTPPLGSGPYKVGRFRAGAFVELERVDDYWGKDMPFAKGLYNFDVLRLEFFRERQAGFEAFKKGQITYRQEFTSKVWETEYDFPAVLEGKVKKRLFPADKNPLVQGWAVNLRRAKFADVRTRQAIGLCFDFEWTNENLFYGAYARNQSYFENSEFEAAGMPSAEELALLDPLRASLPQSAFGEAVMQPVSNGSGRDRTMLRQATKLLTEAGWVRQGRQLVNKDGEPFTLEFLIRSPTFERILGKFVSNLKAVGVDASIRLVDPAQFQLRMETFDFDLLGIARGYDSLPTFESVRNLFSSETAKTDGSMNLAGVADPAVDTLIGQIDAAGSREELGFVLRALDRVLRSTHSWIPNWHSANHRVAHWDMYGYPEPKPDFAFPVEAMWWFDKEKAEAIGKG